MSATEKIIEKFGGVKPLADALGHVNSSTVQGWKERGNVPSRQIPLVLQAAADAEIPLSHSDFFE